MHGEVICYALVMHRILLFLLDSWINHPDGVEPLLMEAIVEELWLREGVRVEGKDPILIHVVDVEPNDIAGDFFVSEGLGDF